MATTQHSIKVTKTWQWRGATKDFSNRYYFDGGSPGDSDAWHTLMDAIVAEEKAMWDSFLHITRCDGYAPGSEVAVASKTYTQAGTLSLGVGARTPGECAAVLRMATTKKSTKNHTVYVFSYFHSVLYNGTSGDPDSVFASQKTAMELYGQHWLDGITVGGRTYKRTTPDGHATTGRIVDPFIGHRDFPR